jgi:hypothetical protein
MEALAARGFGQSSFATVWPRLALHSLLCLAAVGASGQEMRTFASTGSTAPGTAPRSVFELSASSPPLFENADGSTRSSRLDMIWLPPRHPNLGLAFGLSTFDGPGFKAPGSTSSPTFDLGLQWRYTLDSQYRIDVTAWRRMAPPDALSLIQNRQSDYAARLEMQIAAMPGSRFVAERGFLGLQLDSGARITVRRTAGHPMVYYRTRF